MTFSVFISDSLLLSNRIYGVVCVLSMMNKQHQDIRVNHDAEHLKANAFDAVRGRKLQTTIVPNAKIAAEVTPDEKPKRKRRSPDKPWKKPKDMPKRPLSAYNLFFRDERERLLKSVDKGTDEGATTVKGKKGKKRSGIGFANLATTIAAKWRELEDDVKAPYEKIAAGEKKRYDVAVAEWRVKQASKKRAAKKEAEDHRRKQREQQQSNPGMFSSERSLGSFSDGSNTYPNEWFHHQQQLSESDPSERDESGMVPPMVETSPGSYDRRAYENAAAWSAVAAGHENPYSYYGYTTEPYMRASPELPRGSYMNRGVFAPPDSRGVHHQYAGYGDYYSLYGQQQHHMASSSLGGDMRMPRAASLPMQYHDFQQLGATNPSSPSQSGQSRGEYSRRSASSHPRSASMPLIQQGAAIAAIETPDHATGEEPTVTASEIAAEAFRSATDNSGFQQPLEMRGRMGDGSHEPPAIGNSTTMDESVVGTSLQSLTESLDDDAISFITSMKYN